MDCHVHISPYTTAESSVHVLELWTLLPRKNQNMPFLSSQNLLPDDLRCDSKIISLPLLRKFRNTSFNIQMCKSGTGIKSPVNEKGASHFTIHFNLCSSVFQQTYCIT